LPRKIPQQTKPTSKKINLTKSNQTNQKNQTQKIFKNPDPSANKTSKSQTQQEKKSDILLSFSSSSLLLFFFFFDLLLLFSLSFSSSHLRKEGAG
jgi:thiol:disulfide interchange protein